ncbi:solute carrier family 26 protein [Pseudenhygromyxa sp. WMMC2535]|uniref:SulP family inorganic anion transporter n=1 Tax=Pseudenhygromyxa sp. WMMC2535 TaxID=2712867 RepID=UPI001552918A|nr:solute carrier family 26 protein [Pseudenhygromyxa sp. WMMC2535]NVB38954.1 solute carrier family 26 protein [Pseudenhygromyxa sp. WMMC2535]
MLEFAKRHLPLLALLTSDEYSRDDLRSDLVAGVTTAVMLIPQGMAYAMLAGLPPIVGLYASLLPLIAYALIGTSRQLAVGPVAMDSLLVAAGVGAIAEVGTEAYIGYAVALALMAGVMQVLMGVARLGFLVNFLSRPVISGFTSAAALIIGLSQLKHLLGVDLERSKHIHEILIQAASRVGEINPITLAIGAVSIALLIALKALAPKIPRALVVVGLGTMAVYLLGLHERGVAIVAEVPAGLPTPAIPRIDAETFSQLWTTALTIAVVAFMEAISVAKKCASAEKYELDPNREFVALGAANIAAGLFRAYPVTGGFSRTAVNAQAGAKSGLSGLITAALVGLTLLFLTPVFYYLPKAVLAAIIMVAVFGLIDPKEVRRLWKVNRADLALLLLTFAITLILGIQQGILIGVSASLLWFVVRTTRPHTAVLGRLPGGEVYRNLARYPEAQAEPGVLTVRIDAQFYFGNVTFLKQTLDRLLRERGEAGDEIFAVVLDASGVNYLDSSADAALDEILEDLDDRRVRLYTAGLKGPVRDAMQRSGLWARLENRRAQTVHQAVGMALRDRDREGGPFQDAASDDGSGDDDAHAAA